MKATTVKEVLVAARWILTHYGWCKGSLWKDQDDVNIYSTSYISSGEAKLGCCCLSGALLLVDTDNEQVRMKAYDLLENHMELLGNHMEKVSVPSWNDQLNRTKQQVINLLNRAIAKA